MLKRINLIRNVGKFYACKPADVEFSRKTIIYGRNGDGKSTLASIFRSLSTNNPTILKGRKSFGNTGDQKIELVFENGNKNDVLVFQNQSWNKPNDKIFIFDSWFIHENIYEGETVEDNHKSNLHRVIIGLEGTRLRCESEELTESSPFLVGVFRSVVPEFSYQAASFN